MLKRRKTLLVPRKETTRNIFQAGLRKFLIWRNVASEN
jgi:hypothetical protein